MDIVRASLTERYKILRWWNDYMNAAGERRAERFTKKQLEKQGENYFVAIVVCVTTILFVGYILVELFAVTSGLSLGITELIRVIAMSITLAVLIFVWVTRLGAIMVACEIHEKKLPC